MVCKHVAFLLGHPVEQILRNNIAFKVYGVFTKYVDFVKVLKQ